jgi:RNA polymerase sigma factor (sigma-70 family)
MAAMQDMELLQEYASQKSEAAFATLVSRHVSMVYSVALRHVSNPHQAEEITQAVFIVLAKKAAGLRQGTLLSGWLFHTARLTATNFLRTEKRRANREQEAYMRSTLHETDAEEWKQVAPLLDEAIAGLGEKDRDAIVLRYVEGKNLQEVGLALGASEDAVKKRVSRAVERLRGFFSKRGIMLSTTALGGMIAVNAVQAAPDGLMAAITTAAMKGTLLTGSTLTLAKGTLKLMVWTKIKIAVGVGVAAVFAFQWYELAAQKNELSVVRAQLQDRDKEIATDEAAVRQLEQEKSRMGEQARVAAMEKSKLIAKQKSAVAAATAAPGAGGKNLSANDVAKLFDDPAANELFKVQVRELLKSQVGGLVKKMNLSSEETDKIYDAVINNELKKRQTVAGIIRGEVDPGKAVQARDATRGDLDNELKSLLGDSNFAKYTEFKQNARADGVVSGLEGELGDNKLSDDQKKQLRKIVQAAPEFPMVDNIDLFRSPESMDSYYHQFELHNDKLRQQTESFLTPEQVQALGKAQASFVSMIKSQMELGKKMVTPAAN